MATTSTAAPATTDWSQWIERERRKAFSDVYSDFNDRNMWGHTAMATPLAEVAAQSAKSAAEIGRSERDYQEGTRRWNNEFARSIYDMFYQQALGRGSIDPTRLRQGKIDFPGAPRGLWDFMGPTYNNRVGDPPETWADYLPPLPGSGPVGDAGQKPGGLPGSVRYSLDPIALKQFEEQMRAQRAQEANARASVGAAAASNKLARERFEWEKENYDPDSEVWGTLATEAINNTARGQSLDPAEKVKYIDPLTMLRSFSTMVDFKDTLSSPDKKYKAVSFIHSLFAAEGPAGFDKAQAVISAMSSGVDPLVALDMLTSGPGGSAQRDRVGSALSMLTADNMNAHRGNPISTKYGYGLPGLGNRLLGTAGSWSAGIADYIAGRDPNAEGSATYYEKNPEKVRPVWEYSIDNRRGQTPATK